MKWFSILSLLMLSCSLPDATQAQKKGKKKPKAEAQNPLKDLVGVYWFPKSEIEQTQPRRGFMFSSEKSVRGHDGCNSFWGDVGYTPEQGFKITSVASTELACPNNFEGFSVYFLNQVKTFEVKGAEIIFYDKDKKEVQHLFSFKEIHDKTLALPMGEWRVIESNASEFEAVKKEGREPWLRLMKDGTFAVCYHKSKEEWTAVNYFAGICNMTKDKLYFHVNAEASVASMENGEDGQLAYKFRQARSWELKDNKLYTRSSEHTFTLERVK